MDCERIRENLAAFIDGELEEGEISDIQAHLEGCAGCRGELKALRRTARSLEEFLEPRAMRESVVDGVLASLASERTRRRVPLAVKIGWALTGAAAAVLILAVFGFLGAQRGAIADEIVDEALADHSRTLELYQKQVGNSAVRDAQTVVSLIKIELQLSGLREKTTRLSNILALSNHPRKHQIEKYIFSVNNFIGFVEDPPLRKPAVIMMAVRRNAMEVSPVRGMLILEAPRPVEVDFDMPKDLDDRTKDFVLAKRELYNGKFARAAAAFNVVLKQAPGSQIAEDAKYWRWYAELHAGDSRVSIEGEGQLPIPRHPALREEMRKDFFEWLEEQHRDFNFRPDTQKIRRMLEKFGEKMGIHVETAQDEDGNTVIKVERKDGKGEAVNIIKVRSVGGK